jgi:4-alpha-glucanotransferase
MILNPEQRVAGIFVPLFALRSQEDLGIGDTSTLKEMIDWCQAHGFRVLQLLPINETSGDNSPYNAVSSVALEPSTLSMHPDQVPGLEWGDLEEHAGPEVRDELNRGPVAYRRVKAIKRELLRRAYERLSQKGDAEWDQFSRAEAGWLKDYAYFRSCMDIHGDSPVWEHWPEEHRSPEAVEAWLASLDEGTRKDFESRTGFYSFQQWVAYRQWQAVREYAESRQVALMGDIPFGLSRHSADVWADQDQFDLKRSGGAPPEPLFRDNPFVVRWGQNWGIPLYRWDVMRENDYAWWRRRVKMTTRIFRSFRVDHILGFYRIFSFPWGPEENDRFVDMPEEEVLARCGELPGFRPRPDEPEKNALRNRAEGEVLLKVILEAAEGAVVIGEDLGVVPDYVRPSLLELGISGFKIPVFERDEASREYRDLGEYPQLSLATLTTHDHITMRGFWESWWQDWEAGRDAPRESESYQRAEMASWELYRTLRMAGLDDGTLIRDYLPEVHAGIVRQLMQSGSWLVILNLTDLFGMQIRFNVPGPVSESNWSERLPWKVSDTDEDPERRALLDQAIQSAREAGRMG